MALPLLVISLRIVGICPSESDASIKMVRFSSLWNFLEVKIFLFSSPINTKGTCFLRFCRKGSRFPQTVSDSVCGKIKASVSGHQLSVKFCGQQVRLFMFCLFSEFASMEPWSRYGVMIKLCMAFGLGLQSLGSV